MQRTKKFWQSKTVWVNTLTLAIGIGSMIAGSDLIAAHPDWAAIFVSATAALNCALRFITSKPITA